MIIELKTIDIESGLDIGCIHFMQKYIVGVEKTPMRVSPTGITSGECYYVVTTGGKFAISKDTYEELLNKISV